MKVLYVESRLKKVDSELDSNELKKLPKKLFLAYSVQYKDLALKVRKQLEDDGFSVLGFKQVLGCSKIKSKVPVFLIGSGRFHAINLYLQVPNVYLLEGSKIVKVSKEEIEKIKALRKGALIKFLSADKIGILVSTKPGQTQLEKAIRLKKDLKKKGKLVYIFVSNGIEINQFENFDIDCWVNTACSGIANDVSGLINIGEIF